MEKYIDEGITYNVAPNRLEEFLQKYPNATKIDEPGKTIGPASSNMDSGSEDGSLEQPEINAWENFKNNVSNAFEMVGDVPEFYGLGTLNKSVEEVAKEGNLGAQSGLNIATTLIYEKVFGVDKMKQLATEYPTFFKGFFSSDSKQFQNVIENFEKEKKDRKRTMTFKEADSIGDYLSVVGGSIANVGGSVAYNFGTLGTGFFMEFASDNFIEANKVKAEANNTTLEGLLQSGKQDVDAPVKIAALQAGLEYFGFSKITKGSGVSRAFNKKVGEYLTKNYRKQKNIRIGLDILGTGRVEAFTEMGQTGLEIYNKELAVAKGKGEDINDLMSVVNGMFSEQGIEAGLQGFFGGAGLKGGTYSAKALNNIRKSDKNLDVEEDLSKLVSLKNRYNSSKDEDVRFALDKEIKKAESNIKDKVKKGNDIYSALSDGNIKTIEELSDLSDVTAFRANNLIEKFKNGQIKEDDFKVAIEGLSNQYKENKQNIQNVLTTKAAEKVTETVKKQIKETGLEGKVTEMTSEEISNIEEKGFDSKTAAGEFGFIKQEVDGSFEIILNKDKPMVGTAAHEFMHAVLFKTIGSNTEIQNNLGDALVEHTSNLGGETSILGERLAAYGKWDGDTFVRDANFGEETITIMSESIIDGSLKFEENFFTKIGDVVRRFSQNYLGKEITFDTGRDVYNFVKDYSKSIKDGKINKAILNVAKEGVKGKLVEGKATPEATVKMSKDIEGKTPEQLIKTIKRGRNPRQVAAAEDALVPQYQALALEALGYKEIKGDILRKNVVSAVNDYYDAIVRNYDPKKGKFSTHVYNNIKPKDDTIFEKAKTLKKRDEGISLDAPEARQVAGDASVTTNLEDTFVQKIDILSFATVGRVADKIKSLVKVKPGNNFKNIISNYAGKVGEIVFNIPAKKIMEGGANLAAVTKYKKGMPAPAEAQNIQRFFNAGQNSDRFIKTLPLYNVTDKTADIDKVGENIEVSRNAYGIAIGLKGLPLDYFYENYTDPRSKSKDPEVKAQSITSPKGRSKGLTTQTQVKRLKPEFRNPTPEVVEQFKQDIGITPKGQENVYNRDIGQLLKGAAKVYSINASLSAAQRNQEAKLKKAPAEQKKAIKQQTADITAAQSKIAFSKSVDTVFGGIKSLLSEKQGKIFDDNLLQFVSTFVGINEAKMSDKQKEQVLLSEDVEAISIALNQAYGDVISKKVRDDIAREIQKEVAKLKLKPKSRNIVKQEKIVEAIIKSTENSTKKIAKYTGSNTTAAEAQNDLVRQEGRRKSDAVYFVNLFNKNKEQAVADLIMLGGSSFTSAKIGDGRGQFYKNSRDYYNYHLGNVGVKPVYNKNGSLNVNATAKKNGLKDIPVTKAAQSSTSAIKDHKNPQSLKERRKHEKQARRVLNEYIAYNVARYKDGLQDNVDIMLAMNSLLSNMNSVLARAAALKYIQPRVKAANARYEHMQPRVAVLIKLVDTYVNGNGVSDINSFLANYDIAIINKEFDKAITDAGYQSTLAEGQSLEDSSLLRYYNDKTLADSRIEVLTEVGTNKVPKLVESFMKSNDLLSTKIKEFKKLDEAIMFSRNVNPEKGITVLDFDDTLATSKSKVISTSPEGVVRKLTAEEFATEGADLLDQGWTHDFSEFSKVVDGKVASLFKKAMKLQGKFGPENMFVLTARPADSAPAIFEFLKANGLNIPLKNITGLANSTPEAKALWIADKVADGYNDFYFADDALQNVQAVQNMLDQFDVKSKVQQARVKFSKSMNDQFNDILENVTGIESKKRFSIIKGRKRGESKGKFRYFVPPSHEDFVGLLYNFMGRGREGDKHRDFLEQALVRPLNRANREYDTARQSIATDYKNLNKQMPSVRKMLTKKTPDGDFTYQDAIRIYLWNKHGHTIPGLSPIDEQNLVDLIKSDPMLQSYADAINIISKQESYVDPTDGWDSGDIRMDLDDATGRVGREQFFAEFIENADIIFSTENLNKIEAGYGKGVREALEDMLYRIKTGRNRPSGTNGLVNRLMDYINGAVGGVMFFNVRSSVLQQMSMVNYLNFADNNIFAAAKAFANQKQYWTDWAFIFNSDMLKQRRGGIQTDVNGAELAETISKSKYPIRTLIRKLLQLGFLPTQIGDNIAIATGGAMYNRNRINK